MPQDTFTLRYLCAELNSVFKGGKVNKITQPSNDELILTVYTGKKTEKLILDVNPAAPRIGVDSIDRESPLTAPNFCMLMRKHLLSATILGLEIVGFDRIVKIDFMASGEFFDAVQKTVYVELMGRYSNVILTENGKILGGNRGINMFDDGVRPLIVGHDYHFPPVGVKKLPTDRSLVESFQDVEFENLEQTILKNVQGIATITAKEIADGYAKIKEGNSVQNPNDFMDYLSEYLFNTNPKPCVVLDGEEAKDVCVYQYNCYENSKIKFFDKLYLAEEFYFLSKEKIKRYKNKKERLSSIINTAIKKVKKKLTAIRAKEKDALSAEDNRIKGELLLSNIYRIKNGQTQCVVENYYDGTEITISLDERLSVSKNAENYYKKYNKQKRTLVALKPQKEIAETELDYYSSVLDEILVCDTIEELAMVQSELESVGILIEKQKSVKKKKDDQTFCREYKVHGYKIRAGRNNTENDRLTFTAKPDDLWLHAKDYHSTHVVIEKQNGKIPENIILVGAQICAYYSKGREGGKTEIVYTERKNVKKPPKSKPGKVIYENFNSLVVEPEKHAEFIKCD